VPVEPEEVARRKELEHKKLKRMVSYATTAACLRATILRYFGDPAAKEPCGACGNCHSRAPLDPADLEIVRKVLSGIARSGERFGRRKVAAMLVGQVDDLPESLRELSTTGILSRERLSDVEHWVDAACGAGLVRVSEDQYRTLSLTPQGREVMAGRVDDVEMTPPAAPVARRVRPRAIPRSVSARSRHGSSGPRQRRRDFDPDGASDWLADDSNSPRSRGEDDGERDYRQTAMEKSLRSWRLGVARQQGVPPYVILHDKTLLAIVTARPQSTDGLLDVPGMGPAKVEKYGTAILALVASIERV
jgi:ATP-dependent DNA helicase RecQ